MIAYPAVRQWGLSFIICVIEFIFINIEICYFSFAFIKAFFAYNSQIIAFISA